MKKWISFVIVMFAAAVLAQAYEAKGSTRSRFGGAALQENEQKGESSSPKTRSFSSYGSTRKWSRGVQTQTVQTSTAGQPQSESQPQKITEQAEKASMVQRVDEKPAVKAEKPAAKKSAEAADPKKKDEKNASASAATPKGGAMPEDVMKQLQGMQDLVKNMDTGVPASAKTGGNAAAANPMAALQSLPQIPGMPDMSALMGGAAGAMPTGGAKK